MKNCMYTILFLIFRNILIMICLMVFCQLYFVLAHLKKAIYFGVASYCVTFVAIEGENDSDESKIYVKLTLPLLSKSGGFWLRYSR